MAPMFDAREFRRSLAAFATGAAIVTTTDGNGLRARAWRHSRAKYFAINVLTADQRELSQRFSSTVADKFDGAGAVSGHGGIPLIRERRNKADFRCDLMAALTERGVRYKQCRWRDPDAALTHGNG